MPRQSLQNLYRTGFRPGTIILCFIFRDSRGHRVIVTEKHARTALATVLRAINLEHQKITVFITFRRSGATLAYKMDVPLTAIQQHGTWLSNAVWA